jgi:phosphatidylinositol-3-phosphatase
MTKPGFKIHRSMLAAGPGLILALSLMLLLAPKAASAEESSAAATPAAGRIDHVWVVVMENHNWADIDSVAAPYIIDTLLPLGAHAQHYYNPPGLHPSEPNYVWMEAGAADSLPGRHDFASDRNPAWNNSTSETNHLVTLLEKAGLSWKAYAEDIGGFSCPLQARGDYSPRHVPFLFFWDVTDNNEPLSRHCIRHIRPYAELASDLAKEPPAYSFIIPNLCNDMHDCSIRTGDTWLARELPKIMNSAAYRSGGAIFVTWDESEKSGDSPIGMIVLSPYAKKNYSNAIHYDHSSLLKTLAEIFGVSTDIGAAAGATDLSDFFTVPLPRSDSHPPH